MNYIVLDLEWNQPFSNKNAINLYKKLDDAVTELNALNIENSYVEGFRFGVLMAIDVLIGRKDF